MDVNIAQIETERGTLINATVQEALDAGVSEAAIREALAQAAWAKVREQRTARLKSTDWTQMPDAPLTKEARASWRAYRDDLRALPASLKEAGIEPAIALNDAQAWPVVPA